MNGPILLLSTSLNPQSHSRSMAREAHRVLRARSAEVRLIDLRDHPLPPCDGEDCDHPSIVLLANAIRSAHAVLIAAPVYNYDVNAAAKNLVEHTGRAAWEGQIVGFLAAAGGQASYMSVMSLANSLMLDFRCLIIPRFVYATGGDFAGETITSDKIRQRIEALCDETIRLATRLKS